jgi:H+-translocating NAD(P) transhydrogenase subunit alpha
LPSRLANQSSQLYATNLRHLLTELCPAKDGVLNVNMEDDVIRGATVIKAGKITWPPPPIALSAVSAAKPAAPVAHAAAAVKPKTFLHQVWPSLMAGVALFGIGSVAPETFMAHFTVFVLSCFVGYQVIWNVTPSLHTPLMSVTNALSGIIVIGAIIQISSPDHTVSILAGLATLIASINIAGGFLVTRRMLEMFRK